MTNIISFSGGKDSTALILWAKENLNKFHTIFIDTGWEHPITYAYVDYISRDVLGGNLIRLKSEKYESFEDLCVKKKRVPSVKARFCTEELKVKVSRNYIETLTECPVELYLGIRADESLSRANMPERDFSNYYNCEVVRPLLKWTAADCFNIIARHNIEPNPLYKMGMLRVGCMPCIMVRHNEMKVIIKRFPDVIENIRRIENKTGRTFFPVNYIPEQFSSKRDPATGKMCPTIDDVVRYLQDNKNQGSLFKEPDETHCMSIYGICE